MGFARTQNTKVGCEPERMAFHCVGVFLLSFVLITGCTAQDPSLPLVAEKDTTGQLSKVLIQYTTDGEPILSILNITFVTTEMRVVVVGCDVGYFDNHAIHPTEKPKHTPFDCMECSCESFESVRTEQFTILQPETQL